MISTALTHIRVFPECSGISLGSLLIVHSFPFLSDQDAHELLTQCLDQLKDDSKGVKTAASDNEQSQVVGPSHFLPWFIQIVSVVFMTGLSVSCGQEFWVWDVPDHYLQKVYTVFSLSWFFNSTFYSTILLSIHDVFTNCEEGKKPGMGMGNTSLFP